MHTFVIGIGGGGGVGVGGVGVGGDGVLCWTETDPSQHKISSIDETYEKAAIIKTKNEMKWIRNRLSWVNVICTLGWLQHEQRTRICMYVSDCANKRACVDVCVRWRVFMNIGWANDEFLHLATRKRNTYKNHKNKRKLTNCACIMYACVLTKRSRRRKKCS